MPGVPDGFDFDHFAGQFAAIDPLGIDKNGVPRLSVLFLTLQWLNRTPEAVNFKDWIERRIGGELTGSPGRCGGFE